MEGPNGVVEHIKSLLATQGTVICLAEGAGQEYVRRRARTQGQPQTRRHRAVVLQRLKREMSCDVKYIDPTYMVQGVTANAHDSICTILGQNAVHEAFAGYTGISIGMVNTHAVFLPIERLMRRAARRPGRQDVAQAADVDGSAGLR